MAKNTVCLWYDNDAEAAARFYARTFPASTVCSFPASFSTAVFLRMPYCSQSQTKPAHSRPVVIVLGLIRGQSSCPSALQSVAEQFPVVLGFFAGAGAAVFELGGFPDLELVAKADERDLRSQAGVGAKAFRKDDASVAIDVEHLDVAIKGDGEFVALI